MRVPGQRSRIASTHRATCAMPPSAQIVAGHHRQHRVGQAHAGDGFGDASGLVVRRRQRLARVDQAEAAGARAPLAQAP